MMPNILTFKYGEAIIYDKETKNFELKNPIADIEVDNLPTQYTFSCAFIITGFDYSKENVVKYELISEDDIVLASGVVKLEAWTMPEGKEGAIYGVNIGVDYRNIFLSKNEKIITKIYFNDEFINGFEINVICKEVL